MKRTMSRKAGCLGLAAILVAAGPAGGADADPPPAMAWGYNATGQLGDGGTQHSRIPVKVKGDTVFVEATTSSHHSLAIAEDGTVWSWGLNSRGQLGDGGNEQRSEPGQIRGLTGIVDVAAGGEFSLAVQADGTLWSWGRNDLGQLGDGTGVDRQSPARIGKLRGVVDVEAGRDHAVALASDGTVWSWGGNANGQLGDGTQTDRHSPVPVPGVREVEDIAAGSSHTLALRTDGTVLGWGGNSFHQLGPAPTTDDRLLPGITAELPGAREVSAGSYHSMARKDDGSVWAWGNNGSGQLGTGAPSSPPTPSPVLVLEDGAVQIAAGTVAGYARREDGTVFSWGDNFFGQLGTGSLAFYDPVPTRVLDLSGVTHLGVGGTALHVVVAR